MGRVSFIVLSTILALLVWTGILIAGTLKGWWRQSLAPSGDSRAFMEAAIAEIDRTRRGNVAFVLIENGKVFDEHFTSVGQPVDRNTLFQVASMSKWITAWGVMTLLEAGKLNLDTAVSTYLTRWSLPKSEFDNSGVTVRRLLSHIPFSRLTELRSSFGPGRYAVVAGFEGRLSEEDIIHVNRLQQGAATTRFENRSIICGTAARDASSLNSCALCAASVSS